MRGDILCDLGVDDVRESFDVTGMLHAPLPLGSDTFEKRQEQIVGEASPGEPIAGEWRALGRGEVEALSGGGVRLSGPSSFDSYPEDWPQDGDYVPYGFIAAEMTPERSDLTDVTHLRFTVRQSCVDVINPAMTITFSNEGAVRVPDEYNRTGSHVIDLTDGRDAYLLDITDMPRDVVTGIGVSLSVNGSYAGLPGLWDVEVERIEALSVSTGTHALGWEPGPSELAYSQIGYEPAAEKHVVVNARYVGRPFSVRAFPSGEVVLEGVAQRREALGKAYAIAGFTEVSEPGAYRIEFDDMKTRPFAIGRYSQLVGGSIVRALNFAFAERCGYPVPGIHAACHTDTYAVFGEVKAPFIGGWHDAGDLSQQAVQTAELAHSLFAASKAVENSDLPLSRRLREEGEWGVDFILRMRLGDGWRASSAGVTRWTQGRVGDMDDSYARVHNSPYDNYLIAGLLADIALSLPRGDWLREKLTRVAKVDYADAECGFADHPFRHEPIMWEHTLNTSKATFLATMAWASERLWSLVGDDAHLRAAERYASDLLSCQSSEKLTLGEWSCDGGFFCRDESLTIPQHFTHQAREHLFAWALTAVATATKDDSLRRSLERAIRSYGCYLELLGRACGPYPMIAAGVYAPEEWRDGDSFARTHLLVDDHAHAEYDRQLALGESVSDKYTLKRFPVWFSFRGNNAVLLSQGMAAASLARHLDDPGLMSIAFGQMQWMCGFNPFGQSMVYGQGGLYTSMYSVSSGQIEGEMPVGVQTMGDGDEPYWPQFNTATYKEVWVGVLAKWLSLASTLI